MKGLKYEITFKELYEYSNIKLNVFALILILLKMKHLIMN